MARSTVQTWMKLYQETRSVEDQVCGGGSVAVTANHPAERTEQPDPSWVGGAVGPTLWTADQQLKSRLLAARAGDTS